MIEFTVAVSSSLLNTATFIYEYEADQNFIWT